MKLVNIGFGNAVNAERVLSVVNPESAPVKRLVQDAKEEKLLIDATQGRKTRAVIITDSNHVILSYLQPEKIIARFNEDSLLEDEKKKKKGRLILFSGPSGVGKDTLLDILFEKCPDLQHSVSVTTRAKRDNETEGKDYHFITVSDFKKMQKDGEIPEFNKYNGNYYATPKKPIDNWLKNGKDVILKIDVHGTENIENLYKDCKGSYNL